MTWENKEEGWVKFRRVYCIEGYIDVWAGDSFHNPNDKIKPSIKLNSSAHFYRLDKEWIRSGKYPFEIQEMSKILTSKEVWEIITKE